MGSILYIELLNREFESRKARNTKYSLRAFARDLGLSPGTLSEVLKQKRGLPVRSVAGISSRIELLGRDRDEFIRSAYLWKYFANSKPEVNPEENSG